MRYPKPDSSLNGCLLVRFAPHQSLLLGEKVPPKGADVGCGTMLRIVCTFGEYVGFIAFGTVILLCKITPHISQLR